MGFLNWFKSLDVSVLRSNKDVKELCKLLRHRNLDVRRASAEALRGLAGSTGNLELETVVALPAAARVLPTGHDISVAVSRSGLVACTKRSEKTIYCGDPLRRGDGATMTKIEFPRTYGLQNDIAISDDGARIACGYALPGHSRSLAVWEIRDGHPAQSMYLKHPRSSVSPAHGYWYINHLAFSPLGDLLAIAGPDSLQANPSSSVGPVVNYAGVVNILRVPGTTRAKPISEGPELIRFEPLSTEVWGLAFSRDGRLLASTSFFSSAGRVQLGNLWAADSGEHLASLEVESKISNEHNSGFDRGGICFSEDGRFLALGGLRRDPHLRIWDIPARRLLGTLSTKSPWATTSLCFSLDGDLLLSGDERGSLRIWKCEALSGGDVTAEPLDEIQLAGEIFRIIPDADDSVLVAFNRAGLTLARIRLMKRVS